MRLMQRVTAAIVSLAVGLSAVSALAADGKKKIVFIAGTPSHGFAQHEHNAGCLLLAKCLKESMGDKVECVVLTSKKVEDGKWVNGWPKDPAALEGAAAIVIYCDGGGGHIAMPHLRSSTRWPTRASASAASTTPSKCPRTRPATTSSIGSADTSRPSGRSTPTGRPTSPRSPSTRSATA